MTDGPAAHDRRAGTHDPPFGAAAEPPGGGTPLGAAVQAPDAGGSALTASAGAPDAGGPPPVGADPRRLRLPAGAAVVGDPVDGGVLSNGLLDMILSVMPDAAVVVDDEGRLVAANDQAGQLFGYEASSLVGRPLEVLVPERYRSRHRAHRAGYLVAPGARSMGTALQLAGRRSDGSEFPIDVSLAPIGGEERTLVVAAVRDVSDRHAAAEAQARLAALVRSNQDGIVTLSPACTVTSWNPGATRLLGFAPEDIVGRHVSTLIPDDESEPFEALLSAAQNNEAAQGIDTRWRRADGSLLDVGMSVSLLDAVMEGTGGFSVIVRDVTLRKAAESQLAHRERWLRALSEIRLAIVTGLPMDALLQVVADELATLLPGSTTLFPIDESVSWPEAPGDPVGDGAEAAAPAGRPTRTGAPPPMPVPRAALDLLVGGDRQRVGRLADLLDEVGGDAPALAAALRGAGHGTVDATVVAAPVSDTEGPVAAVVVTTPAQVPTAEDAGGIAGLAEQLTLGLRLVQWQQRERQLLLADDRARIARDLHDHVIQALFAAGMRLQSALPLVGDERAAGWISDIVGELDDTIGRIRTTIFSLEAPRDRPAGGLRAAVLDLSRAAAGQLGFEPDVRFAGAVETVPDRIRPHLLAVAREALSNAARHAGASRVAVEVGVHDGRVSVVVTDDGRGIGTTDRTSGLANARGRARELGGDLVLSPAPGGGTVFDWHVPL